MNPFYIISIFFLTIFTAVGDSFLKRSGELKNTNFIYLLTGLAVYLTTGIIWFFIYKHVKFSSVGSVYGVSTALVFATIGIFYFKESVNTLELVGLVLAVTSIFLLGRYSN